MNQVIKTTESQFSKTVKETEKPLYGFFLAIFSSLMMTTSNIITKKSEFFNGFEISFVRYTCMFLSGSLIAKSKGIEIFSSNYPTKVLLIRSFSGCGLILFTVAVTLIDPSDVTSLFATQVLYIAVLSRIFFKEKFSIIHIAAFAVVFCGVLLVTQPSFLFTKQNNLIANNTALLNRTLMNSNDYESVGLSTRTTGYILAFIAPIGISISSITTKELANRKVHYSIISLYAAVLGAPISLSISIFMVVFNYDGRDFSQVYEIGFIYEVTYLILAGLTSVVAQLCWINANRFEDPSKVSMYKTSDLVFTFIFQYIFLGIQSNIFSISGSVCIATGILTITAIKVLEQNMNQKSSTLNNKDGLLKKIISYKF